MQLLSLHSFALLLPLLALACTPAAPPPTFELTGSCTTSCSMQYRRCIAQGERDFDRCDRSCAFNCIYCANNWSSSERVCELRRDQCSGCVEGDFAATVEGSDPYLESSCVAAWERLVECGATGDPVAACAHFATIEDRSMVETYECFAESECGAECGPPKDTEGARTVCAELEACDYTCGEDLEALIAGQLSWLRPDVRGTLDGCLALTCSGGRAHCVNAWLSAVFP